MIHAHFYLPPPEWEPGPLRLVGDEARHCVQVTRHRAGDVVVVFDGAGRKAEARIEAAEKHEVRLTLLKEWQVPKPARPLTLLQAVTKGDTFEWILEKAVELGVRRIVPVLAERSVVRLEAREAERKHDKWRRLVLEACKQCGQAWLPELAPPCPLAAALAQKEAACLGLVASLQSGARPLRDLLRGKEETLCAAVAIGPEGDFSGAEHLRLEQAGWLPWSLGGLVLRSETAAISALAVLSHELNS